ncbi:MAG TPA: hypothetical protein QGG47_15740 [Acidobacteriota bacterium]|nr:hypothetical protein [Acidobacteriota bacterium]
MRKHIWRVTVAALVLALLLPVAAEAQGKKKKKKKKKKSGAVAQKTVEVEVMPLFVRGDFSAVVEAVDEASGPEVVVSPDAVFVAGLSQEAMSSAGKASRTYAGLDELGRSDPWHHLGVSAAALVAGDLDQALKDAERGVELANGDKVAHKYAHFQQGRVLLARQDFAASGDAFVRTLQIDGDFAYAHYWAGFSYNKTGNLVSMTNHFERFLELAPEAPERQQVVAILAAMY